MANPKNYTTNLNVLQLDGAVETINSQSIKVLMRDSNQDILLCSGTVVVTDGGVGFAKAGKYIKTDVAAGTGAEYLNKGTNLSCAFTLTTQA